MHLSTKGEILANIKLTVITVVIFDAAVLAVKAVKAARAESRKHVIPFKVPEFQM